MSGSRITVHRLVWTSTWTDTMSDLGVSVGDVLIVFLFLRVYWFVDMQDWHLIARKDKKLARGAH